MDEVNTDCEQLSFYISRGDFVQSQRTKMLRKLKIHFGIRETFAMLQYFKRHP